MVLYNDFWYKKYIVVKIFLVVCNIFFVKLWFQFGIYVFMF